MIAVWNFRITSTAQQVTSPAICDRNPGEQLGSSWQQFDSFEGCGHRQGQLGRFWEERRLRRCRDKARKWWPQWTSSPRRRERYGWISERSRDLHIIHRSVHQCYLFSNIHKCKHMLNAWKLPALVQATTVVFHQFETGLREGTIYTKVQKNLQKILTEARTTNRASVPFNHF